ncbi:MAG: hypothetical protein FWG35_03065 [Spirochaetaceae bacterium]|nr:hypothetical protein [Spirochaetaceae bacterium]
MEIMTDEEAFALSEHYTKNPPKVDPSKARIRIPLVRLDSMSAEYLAKESKATHKKPEEIISDLIREKLRSVSAVL